MLPFVRNKKYIKYYLLVVSTFLLFSIISLSDIRLDGIKNLAGVFFVDSITKEELEKDYALAEKGNDKIKILIAPGHDEGRGGTEFRGIKERDLNIEMAEILTRLLRKEGEFEVSLSRNKNEYHKGIQTYIEENYDEIKDFRKEYKDTMDSLVRSGLVDTRNGVEHNNAPNATVIRLYGINKWANENDIDIVIHIHFNDHSGRRYNQSGKYSGITIYIPEKQFSNAKASLALAKSVFKRLSTYSATSNMPLERKGIVEDQELIATGAYNTLDPAVLLIEYGYIYEAQFINPKTRTLAIEDLALQTYFGVLDFFGKKELQKNNIYNTATLPYLWNDNLKKGVRGNKDVFALQTALAFQFFYPPTQKSKNDCPVNGNFGPCTARAVIDFQKKYNIEPASGFVGPITRFKLNTLFSTTPEASDYGL